MSPKRKTATRRRRPDSGRRAKGKATGAPSTIFVIDMVPKSLSAETAQDSEPHLTVNPANPQQIVGTAFTPDPAGGSSAPIYISSDAGNTWKLNSIVPSVAGSDSGTGDITTGFSGKGTKLYASILNAGNSNLQEMRTANPFVPTPMTVFVDRPDADQPFTYARLTGTKERLHIGVNDFAGPGGRTATVDESLNAGVPPPPISSVRMEQRTTLGQDGPQIRTASHADGTVYAAFYRWRSSTGNFQGNTFVVTSADVVVVRDDNFGGGANPFTSLVDPGDGLSGNRVVQGVTFPFMVHGTAATGQQRLGGSISIAVDPGNSANVYLVYGDRLPGSVLTLHVRASKDRGSTWSGDLLTVSNATNGAIAVTTAGVIGFLYQQIRGTASSMRWQTHLRQSSNGTNWADLVLADTPAMTPPKAFDPYIGDYDHLVAVGKDLCGVFSANNTPDKTHFPNGVVYQRNANFTTRQLLRLDGTTVVAPSIDPFFFRVTG